MAETKPGDSAKDNVVKEETPAEKPNIIFVGEGAPTKKINNGTETIKLPDVAEQATEETDGETGEKYYTGKPFYHEKAGTIIQLFPLMYKKFVEKGK